jgi:hypothetical protein
MKKLTTIFGLFLYCLLGAFASKTQAQAEPCAFGQAMQAALAQNPSFTGILAQSDQAYVDFLLEKSGANTQKYLIPTVFHVIHNNGPENISDAQISMHWHKPTRNYPVSLEAPTPTSAWCWPRQILMATALPPPPSTRYSTPCLLLH